jgi:hypothetical protein
VWVAWLERNAIYFSNDPWPLEKIESVLWKVVLDHGQIAWRRTKLLIKKFPVRHGQALDKFDQVWCKNHYFGNRAELDMQWNQVRPCMGWFNYGC